MGNNKALVSGAKFTLVRCYILPIIIIIFYNNFIKTATTAVELYNWHSKTTNANKLIKTKI